MADFNYIQAYKQLERKQNVLILERETDDNKAATRRCLHHYDNDDNSR